MDENNEESYELKKQEIRKYLEYNGFEPDEEFLSKILQAMENTPEGIFEDYLERRETTEEEFSDELERNRTWKQIKIKDFLEEKGISYIEFCDIVREIIEENKEEEIKKYLNKNGIELDEINNETVLEKTGYNIDELWDIIWEEKRSKQDAVWGKDKPFDIEKEITPEDIENATKDITSADFSKAMTDVVNAAKEEQEYDQSIDDEGITQADE